MTAPNTAFRERPVHGARRRNTGELLELSQMGLRVRGEQGSYSLQDKTQERRELHRENSRDLLRLLLGCLAENDQYIHRRKLVKVGERTTKRMRSDSAWSVPSTRNYACFYQSGQKNPQFLGALAREIRRILLRQWSMINPGLNCSCLVEQKSKLIFKRIKLFPRKLTVSQNKLQEYL